MNIKENFQIRDEARARLSGNWLVAIGVSVVVGLIGMGLSVIPFVGTLISIFITGALYLGVAIFYLNFIRKGTPVFEDAFIGFNFLIKAFLVTLLSGIIIFLWSLLLIVPGIIAAIAYSQVYYILAENPEMDVMDVLRKSKEMMYGYKSKYFLLYLSFIGWALLSIITCGIGYLFLDPYVRTSFTIFYLNISGGDQVQPTYVDASYVEQKPTQF